MEKSTMSAILLVLHLLFVHLQYSGVHSLANSHPHDFRYLKFVYNATDRRLEGSYDYIVVGGGTSGCPLAATLSAKYKVLLLERGSLPIDYPNTSTSSGFAANLQQEDDGKTPVERFVSLDGIDNVRGRVLGGTSTISAGTYARANASFYGESGVNWDLNLVNKAYQWVEDSLVVKPKSQSWQSVIGKAYLETGFLPDNGFSLDHKEGTRLTGSIFDNNGTRHASDELLSKGNPKNLRVAVHASVEKILFSSNKSSICSSLSAIGVIYRDSYGRPHRAFVRGKGEVILSAGTIGTAHLLLLSGVGPKSQLLSQRIPVVRHHPHVGQFVYDNPRNFINILPPYPIEASIVTVIGVRSEYYQISLSSLPLEKPAYSLFPASYPLPNSTFAHIVSQVPGPLSYGSVTLKSSFNVKIPPNVRFNYFSNPTDLALCVKGMKKLGEVLRTKTLRPYKARNVPGIEGFNYLGAPLPKNQNDDKAFQRFCRDNFATYWHYHGGSLVGKVLDDRFRVKGIKALRVVDASTFPYEPNSHPMGFYMMLGRYVALQIQREISV
ncbi:hypothetical protein L3X38_000531 [Prunus dulcis]|uniref:(R)-mandelonitrile lyase n=1 Tax=Prunus dulcis TaxID=3755 RepID=A0AAD4WRW6_PRUDU|nr:hypothetical protein L3X38_000531 [Prunus dulcis]